MQGTTAIYDIIMVNFDSGSYLHLIPKKVLSKTGKGKKDLYLQACLERIHYFTPMVYSVDRIPRSEALSAQKRLSVLLSFKLKRKCYDCVDL